MGGLGGFLGGVYNQPTPREANRMTLTPALTRGQRLDFYYWMRLTRTFDERMVALWKQGRGVGGGPGERPPP